MPSFHYFKLFAVLFLSPFILCSQQIQGSVVDSIDGQPLAYVSVLLENDNGDYRDGTTTDKKGQFSLMGAGKNHYLSFSFIGYQTTRLAVAGQTFPLIVQLQPATEFLNTVEVRAERTTTRQLIDRRVIEVGEDLQSAGGDAATILGQLPQIQLNGAGDLRLRGSGNVTLLVNGKPSPLSSADLLRQLPAANILRVEIITAPSARQRADGLTGIINIVTRRNPDRGTTIGAQLSANNQESYRAELNGGYGLKDFGIFAAFSYVYKNYPSNNTLSREGFQPFQRTTSFGFIGPAYYMQVGADWSIDPRNQWSVTLTHTDDRHDHPYRSTIITDRAEDWFSLTEHVHLTTEYHTNFRHYFDRAEKKRFIEADLQYSWNPNELLNKNLLPVGSADRQFTLQEKGLLEVSIDYEHPLPRGKLETGFRYTGRSTDSEFSRGFAPNLSTAAYQYRQPTAAAYALLNHRFGKWEVQGGLRYEDYRLRFDFSPNGLASVQRHFTDFFPSLHLLWRPAEGQSVNLGYSRHTARPGTYALNPFRLLPYPTDRTDGNTRLVPEYAQNFELAYLYEKKKLTTRLAAYLRPRRSQISRVTLLTGDTLVNTWVNLGNSFGQGVEFSIDYRPSALYGLSVSGEAGWSQLASLPTELSFGSRRRRFINLGVRQNFTLWRELKLDVNWQAQLPEREYFSRDVYLHRFDAALRYTLPSAGFTFSLRGEDLLASNRFAGRRFGPGFIVDHSWLAEAPRLVATVGYRFKRGKEFQQRKKKK